MSWWARARRGRQVRIGTGTLTRRGGRLLDVVVVPIAEHARARALLPRLVEVQVGSMTEPRGKVCRPCARRLVAELAVDGWSDGRDGRWQEA